MCLFLPFLLTQLLFLQGPGHTWHLLQDAFASPLMESDYPPVNCGFTHVLLLWHYLIVFSMIPDAPRGRGGTGFISASSTVPHTPYIKMISTHSSTHIYPVSIMHQVALSCSVYDSKRKKTWFLPSRVSHLMMSQTSIKFYPNECTVSNIPVL